MSRRNIILVGAVVWIAALRSDKVSVDISPRGAFVGRNATVLCHVPKEGDPRVLTLGVEGWGSSEREWNTGQLTYSLMLRAAPCDAGDAFCLVHYADGHRVRAVAQFLVLGCGY